MENKKLILARHETLATSRLRLRKMAVEDATDLLAFKGDVTVAAMAGFNPLADLTEAQNDIVNFYTVNRHNVWAIEDQSSRHVIGDIMIWITGQRGEFAWALNQRYWGRGLMPEAARCLRELAFDKLELAVLVADHFADNTRSGRVMQKLGMTKIGQIYSSSADGSPHLSDYYALRRDDYLEKIKNND